MSRGYIQEAVVSSFHNQFTDPRKCGCLDIDYRRSRLELFTGEVTLGSECHLGHPSVHPCVPSPKPYVQQLDTNRGDFITSRCNAQKGGPRVVHSG